MNNDTNLKPTYPTKNDLTKGWSEFFDGLKSENVLFALTVVFRPVDANNSRERWETDYKNGVLRAFRRAVERSKKAQETCLPYDDFFYFERNEGSIHRVSGSRRPFHIHALLPIRRSQAHRIWSEDLNCLKERIEKDIYSIDTVASLLVEKVREGHTLDWTRYITKQKQV